MCSIGALGAIFLYLCLGANGQRFEPTTTSTLVVAHANGTTGSGTDLTGLARVLQALNAQSRANGTSIRVIIPPGDGAVVVPTTTPTTVSKPVATTARASTTVAASDRAQADETATIIESPRSRMMTTDYGDGDNVTATPPPTTSVDASLPQMRCTRTGVFANPDEPCSARYLVCVGGARAFVRQCPTGFLFDATTVACRVAQEIARCNKGGVAAPTTTTAPHARSTTAPPSSDEPVEFTCAGRRYGNHPSASTPCSNTYYTCGPASTQERHCPPNTFYDTQLDQCLFFDQVPECSGTSRAPPTSTLRSEPTTEYQVYDCTNLETGDYPAGPCLPYFYKCANGRSFQFDCGVPGLRYKHEEGACVEPFEIPGCRV